jgi:hypothetical protein
MMPSMQRRVLILRLLALSAGPWNYLSAQTTVRLIPHDSRDYHPWITQLLAARTDWSVSKPDSAVGKQFRLVVLTSEVYNTLLVEEVRLGAEGCCARIASVRKLDLDAMAKHFGLVGEMAGVRIVSARSPTSFRLVIHRRTFDVSHVDRSAATVMEVK